MNRIVFGIVVVCLVVGGAAFYVGNIILTMKKDMATTITLSETALSVAKEGPVSMREIEPELWDPADFDKFVYLEWHPFETDGENFRYMWDSKMNKLLGTAEFLSDNGIGGVVAGSETMVQVGNYTRYQNAYRRDKLLYFIKLPERVMVKELVIEGSDPPSSIKSNETHGYGKLPGSKEVAAAILSELGR